MQYSRARVLLGSSCQRWMGKRASCNKHGSSRIDTQQVIMATFRSRSFTVTTKKEIRNKIFRNDNPWMVSKTIMPGSISLSEVAGHVSFVGVCIAYLNTDILMLRLLSMGSISLSIIFQYYRAIPLWIPIRWNTLLLGINSFMTGSLVLERQRANNMPQGMESIYRDGHFEKRGFSKVEFMRLFAVAKKVALKQDTCLARDGHVNEKLYFVTQGSIRIERKGKRIALLTANHFVGEMTFLAYLQETEDTGTVNSTNCDTTASADAFVQEAMVAYVWDFDSLKEFLGGEREVCNALSAYMNHDLRTKLAAVNQ